MRKTVIALAMLYTAQGIPYGFATEYLPVVLRESGLSYTAIAAVGWLQLPWQLKILWAKAADQPVLRARTRFVILAMQLGLTVAVAAFAARPLREAPTFWFVLTFIAAALAATQDIFVDAFAVRVLGPDERGYGNTAQVAGYRLGMLIGGAALLLLVGRLGEPTTLLACAGVVGAASIGAFVATERSPPLERQTAMPVSVATLVKHTLRRETFVVLALASTFKLGLHMAVPLLKPMAVDYGWSKQQIGAAVVSVGSAAALAGSAAGGFLHRLLHERRALTVALVIQALVCAPLVAIDRLHAPLGLTTIAIGFEHFGSGLGTTVLFAALMSATRPADAGLHYTLLTSANALALGLGSQLGGFLADAIGKSATFTIATVVCALPALLVPQWERAASASRHATNEG